MGPFGSPVKVCTGDAVDGFSVTSAEEDIDRVCRVLTIASEGRAGFLRIFRPCPTAAFAPRDTTLPKYRAAAEALRGMRFATVERRAGGQLAVYDAHALVIDLVAHHPEPRVDVVERFRLFSEAIASAFRNSLLMRALGV